MSEKDRESFKILKLCLTKPPVLSFPKSTGTYTEYTDACDPQFDCVLTQEQSAGHPRPVVYWSRSLKKAERYYDKTERKFLGFVWVVAMLQPYVQGTRFFIRTDRKALRWIIIMTYAKVKLAIWRLRLSVFDYDIVHRAGINHQAADSLSRFDTTGEDTQEVDDDVPLMVLETT